MFVPFFYLLRERGIKVTLSEWMSLLEALSRGLHNSSLNDFYYLCRAIIVHDESDFDKYDQAFLEYFKDVPYKHRLPDEVLEWLNKPLENMELLEAELEDMGFPREEIEELLKDLEKRLQTQDEEHNGGSYWIGTGGQSAFGNGGFHPCGVRIGGATRYRTALTVAEGREYKDFRKDGRMDTRQFQAAFKALRQFSNQVISSEQEFDIDGTIRATCDNAGTLKIKYKHPRRNAIKLLLLIDSGGSMSFHSRLVSALFQAATKSNHFKELHTYYFHNCIYDNLWTEPLLRDENSVDAKWVLKNFDSDYRVLFVGDAAMSRDELFGREWDWDARKYSVETGYGTLSRFRRHFPYVAWLNPDDVPDYMSYRTETQMVIKDQFPMFKLSAEGLEQAMKNLMSRR